MGGGQCHGKSLGIAHPLPCPRMTKHGVLPHGWVRVIMDHNLSRQVRTRPLFLSTPLAFAFHNSAGHSMLFFKKKRGNSQSAFWPQSLLVSLALTLRNGGGGLCRAQLISHVSSRQSLPGETRFKRGLTRTCTMSFHWVDRLGALAGVRGER